MCKSWCYNFILPAVPGMISSTQPNLDRIGLRINERREERLIQAHPEEPSPTDMDVYRQVVRFQLYAHALLSSSMPRELDLLVEFLLRAIHESFIRWRSLVCREILEEESLGEMKELSKITFFHLWWRRFVCGVFDIQSVVRVFKITNGVPLDSSTFVTGVYSM